MKDAGLDLSPFRRLREVSLNLTMDRSLRANLPRFSPITSGRMSKITIVAKPDSQAKEISSLFRSEDVWKDVDQDLLQLAEFQGGDNAQPVALVVDLGQTSLASSRSRTRERKRFERNRWIERASRCSFPKFSQMGKIDFTLPPPVSGSMLCFNAGRLLTYV